MKILIITTHLNPGGIPRYVLNLAKGLRQNGCDVCVASSGGGWLPVLTASGTEHKWIPIKTKSIASPKLFISFLMLLPFLRREKFDVIHCNTRATQMLGALIRFFLGIPCVSTFHGYYTPHFARKRVPLCGDMAIAVSNSVKEHMIKDLLISDKKISVVYNGIDDTAFTHRSLREPNEHFTNGDFVVGILGRISVEKGHFLGLDAFRLVKERYPRAKMLVAGFGRLKDKLEIAVRDMGMGDSVIVKAITPDDFFDAVDIMLVPSSKEGFGYVVLEAFIKKVPVVGFNTGGIAEIISDGHNGLLFDDYAAASVRDKIEMLVKDDVMRRSLINNALLSTKEFSLDKMITQTMNVYTVAVAAAGRKIKTL
jgi:glycosyltransferase involved in cell wall biosynthesis